MSFDQFFKLWSTLLIAAGFAGVAWSGGVSTVAGVLFISALAASWFLDTARLRRALSPWVLNTLVAAYLPFYVLDWRLLSRSLVTATLHLVLFIGALKLLTLATDRDYIYLYLISFVQVLVASTLTIELTFAPALVFFLFSGVTTLVLFEMRRSHARAQSSGRIDPLVGGRGRAGLDLFYRFPAWRMLALSATITATVLALSVPLFLVLPRVALGIYHRPRGSTRMVSGFSERVELGQGGAIRESDAVVMKVRLGEPPARVPMTIKWRGVALDRYEGGAWTRSRHARRRAYAEGRFFRLESSTTGTGILWQTFFVEALATDVVFAARKVLAVTGDLGWLQIDDYGGMHTAPHPLRKLRYAAVSDITPADPRLMPQEQAPFPPEVVASGLQVPALDPRIGELAGKISGSESHPFMKARALERHLRNGYRYTLELAGAPPGSDPLAVFLFETRAGHCEYFATALAIMLRQIGIPARLVNGFRLGEYNRLGDAWVVRQYDAHSWVEAYFKPYGWIEFDPTPAAPRRLQPALLRWFSALLEATDMWWWEGVVTYDIWKQYDLLNASASGMQSARSHLRGRISEGLLSIGAFLNSAADWAEARVVRWAAAALALAAAAALYVGLARPLWARRLRRRVGRALAPRDRPAAIRSFYAEGIELLEAHGIVRARNQTPLEFARCLRNHPASGALLVLTEIYNRARFGASFTDEDGARAEACLGAIRAALRGITGTGY